MGLLLSILFSYVGAVELMFIVRDIVHQVGLHHDQMKVNLLSSKSTSSSSSSSCSLHDLQENLRKSVKSAQERLCESDSVQMMADGIQYEQGYRIPNANEQDISKRWLEARASVTIEPAHNQAATNLRNDFVKATVVMTNDGQNNGFRWGDSLSNSIVSVETVEEKRSTDSQIDDDNTNRKNHLMDSNNERIDDNENGEMVPNIHFDEYSQDYSHAFDGMRKNQSKNDDSRRRKSYKVFTGGHSGDDILQRRRSEDIDGEANNPWGELKPESFHDHNLWKRERAMSIAENDEMMVFVDENSYQEIFEKESKPLNSFTAIENGNAIFNDNKTETQTDRSDGAAKSADVSSENQFNLNASFSENILPHDGAIEMKTNLPEILINESDIVESLDEDANLQKCVDNSWNFDNDDASTEIGESFSILNYPLDNCESVMSAEGELKDFSIVQCGEYESKDLANENKSSDFNSKPSINNRKLNMFAFSALKQSDDDENKSHYIYKPAVRITPTEDERVEQFLHENCEADDDVKNQFIGEKLIKSKTTQMFDCSDEDPSDIDSLESDSRANSPSVESACRDSLLSDIGSDPIQFECKQSTEPNYFCKREDSSSSNNSNVLFERSQSRFSELEYIKGRDDWKDSDLRYDISEEIDSDNYHHLRRHSEAADTLEYIRGREDWLRNEIHHARRNSLGRIFEIGEPKFLIQDEIDSDEYHHHFLQNEMFNESSKYLAKSFTESAQARSFGGECLVKNNSSEGNATIDIDDKSLKSSPECKGSSRIESATVAPNIDITFNNSNKTTETIEGLITHGTTQHENLEITVIDMDENLNMKQTKESCSPFNVISETKNECTELSIESFQKQIPGRLFPTVDIVGVPITYFNTDNMHSVTKITNDNEIQNATIQSVDSQVSKDTKYASPQQNIINFMEKLEISPQKNRNVRAKSERLDSMSSNLLMPTEQTPRRSLSFENVEDLIRDVSNGPWFHK